MSVLNPGLPLLGKQLPTIPPNSTNDEQIAALNSIIDKLNNNTQDIVLTGTVDLPIDGSAAQVFTVPHLLGYKPRAFAYFNGVTLSFADPIGKFKNVDIPLPSSLSSNIPGGGGGSLVPIAFYSWMDMFVDKNNLYFRHQCSDPTIILTLPVTYYLTRQPSN